MKKFILIIILVASSLPCFCENIEYIDTLESKKTSEEENDSRYCVKKTCFEKCFADIFVFNDVTNESLQLKLEECVKLCFSPEDYECNEIKVDNRNKCTYCSENSCISCCKHFANPYLLGSDAYCEVLCK